jgi:hypothetical protein
VFGKRRPKGKLQEYPTSGQTPVSDYRTYPSRHPDDAWRHADAYEQGREALQAEVGPEEEGGPFVAKAFPMQRPDGTAFVYTTWTEGVPTLLPAADVILLAEQPTSSDGKPTFTRVRWDVVAEECADECWEVRPDLKPPMVQTIAWPSKEALAWLKAQRLD